MQRLQCGAVFKVVAVCGAERARSSKNHFPLGWMCRKLAVQYSNLNINMEHYSYEIDRY